MGDIGVIVGLVGLLGAMVLMLLPGRQAAADELYPNVDSPDVEAIARRVHMHYQVHLLRTQG